MTPLIRLGAARSGIALPEPPPSDPFFANVVSLLHMDGADGATAITDVKGKVWTAVGQAQLDTAQFKFGTASALFDGSGDRFTSPDSNDWAFGSGDFTVECWVRAANLATTRCPVAHYNASTGARSWLLQMSSTAITFGVSYTGGGVDGSAVFTAAISTNTWYHLAGCRVGANLRVFVNGVVGGTVFNIGANALANTGALATIGDVASAGQPFNGWIDDVRITKGIGRYSANFTPPDAPFPDE